MATQHAGLGIENFDVSSETENVLSLVKLI